MDGNDLPGRLVLVNRLDPETFPGKLDRSINQRDRIIEAGIMKIDGLELVGPAITVTGRKIDVRAGGDGNIIHSLNGSSFSEDRGQVHECRGHLTLHRHLDLLESCQLARKLSNGDFARAAARSSCNFR